MSVDELLSVHSDQTELAVQLVPEEERKELKDMMLRIIIDSCDGDKIRINHPMALVQATLNTGMEMPQLSAFLCSVDLNQVMELVFQGAVGNLLEIESA